MITCALCGSTTTDPPPLTWTSATERDRLRYFCERCSREHLRSIEAKLDPEWW